MTFYKFCVTSNRTLRVRKEESILNCIFNLITYSCDYYWWIFLPTTDYMSTLLIYHLQLSKPASTKFKCDEPNKFLRPDKSALDEGKHH